MPKSSNIEKTYVKMKPIEHILQLPDTYIGSVEKNDVCLWVHNGDKLVKKKIKITLGLYKIYDEVLVNAIDQHSRLYDEWINTKSKAKRAKINLVTKIDINIDQEVGTIEVINDGKGIEPGTHRLGSKNLLASIAPVAIDVVVDPAVE